MVRRTERTDTTIDTIVSVGDVRFGLDPFPVIAGPCAVESEDQIFETARAVAAAGADVLRGGTVASSSSPYGFSGLGEAGVSYLAQAGHEVGLPVVTQVNEPRDVEVVMDQIDMIEIASADMQNFELLRAVGSTQKPVLLKRAQSATIDEWLWAAEYILAEGNDQIVMCERGIRTFGDGPTLDITSVPAIRERCHLPVIVFPSHAAGDRSRVPALSLAAQGVGANGLVVEVHPRPADAATNSEQQIDFATFIELISSLGVNRMRLDVDQIDREMVRLLARRRDFSRSIGKLKAEQGLPIRSVEREAELLDDLRSEAKLYGMDQEYIVSLFELVLEQSRKLQEEDRSS